MSLLRDADDKRPGSAPRSGVVAQKKTAKTDIDVKNELKFLRENLTMEHKKDMDALKMEIKKSMDTFKLEIKKDLEGIKLLIRKKTDDLDMDRIKDMNAFDKKVNEKLDRILGKLN